jgi:uncharacterized membrane protein YvbJ
MFCKNCKKQIGENEKFCGYCGIKVDKDNLILEKNKQTNDYFSKTYSDTQDKSNHGEIVAGAIMLLIGVVLTWITYEAASGGGTYFVFWGLIIYGGYKVIKGLTS